MLTPGATSRAWRAVSHSLRGSPTPVLRLGLVVGIVVFVSTLAALRVGLAPAAVAPRTVSTSDVDGVGGVAACGPCPAPVCPLPAPPCPSPISACAPVFTATRSASAASFLWPKSAVVRSTDGRPYSHLALVDMWGWSPSGRAIISGDTFREGCPYVCDDDYGVGARAGCRFSANDVTDTSGPARVYAKLPTHYEPARALLRAAGGKAHVFVHGGGDVPVGDGEVSVLGTPGGPLGMFAINVPRSVAPNRRVLGIPLGVERTISPRGRFPGLYTNQHTGFNLAAKLCWAPVLAAELFALGGSLPLPLLYMNFRTETNAGVRSAARRAFEGQSWVVDHVDAGDAVDLRLPSSGFSETRVESALRAAWRRHAANVTSAPWFTAACGAAPLLPRGLDPSLVGELGLPGYPLFLKFMASAPFVLAPEGNGVSTHRAWETLYVGGLPVIREVNAATDDQYRGLPVMLVSDWSEVTPTALVCFALELFVKALGVPAGGAAPPWANDAFGPTPAGFVSDESGVRALLSALDPSGTLAGACAAPIARYAAAHPHTHVGYLSLDSLDGAWWDAFIARHSARLQKLV